MESGVYLKEVYRHLQRTDSNDSMGSPKRPSLTPSESSLSLGSICPSLVKLFNHIRQPDRTSLSKDDLRKLIGSQVDNAQLDMAFENLDVNKDGEISLDEFISGFSRFWKEAPPTPGMDIKTFSPSHLLPPRRPLAEEHYEYGGEEEEGEALNGGPTEEFQRTLLALSSHNRHSMEHLWKSLREANPELLSDFEEFVAEVASEVEGAQRALDNQRRANKREAMELDDEIESRLSAAQTTLNIQTSLVRHDEKVKLERKLVSKESELFSVRNELEELGASLDVCAHFALQLESEIVETQDMRLYLEQQCQDLTKEKQELKMKLEVSEKKLQETQKTEGQLEAVEKIKLQQKVQSSQEVDLLQQKTEYEEEITKLRKQLELYSQQQEQADREVAGLMLQQHTSEVHPSSSTSILHPGGGNGSLLKEIVARDGFSSPLLGRESGNLFSRRQGSIMKKKKKGNAPQGKTKLSFSLPDLTDIDSLEADVAEVAPARASNKRSAGKKSADRRSVYIPRSEEEEEKAAYYSLEQHQNDYQHHYPLASSKSPSPDSVEHPLQDDMLLRCQPLDFIQTLTTQPDYIFKILVVGNSYVGKSSFLIRLCNNSFSQRYSSTIGVDFYSKSLKVDDKVVSLQLWDTAGQERYQSVTKAYYRGAHGIILLYDITQEDSFIAVKSWINSIQENVGEIPSSLCLVGNKLDLDLDGTNEREVSTETGETFAKIYNARFIEASAKTGCNVGDALLMIVGAIKSHHEEHKESTQHNQNSNITVSEPTESKCCSSS